MAATAGTPHRCTSAMRLMERAHPVDLKLVGIEMSILEQYCVVLAVRTRPQQVVFTRSPSHFTGLASYCKSQIRPAASTVPCNSLITLIWQVSL